MKQILLAKAYECVYEGLKEYNGFIIHAEDPMYIWFADNSSRRT